MAQSQPHSSSTLQRELNNLADEHHPIVAWLTKHGLTLLGALGVLFAALLLLYRFAAGSETASITDFIQADRQFSALENDLLTTGKVDITAAEAQLKKIDALLQRYPELQQKYDGPIAQMLISSDMTTQAIPYAKRLLQRTAPQKILGDYHAFGSATLAIAQDDTAEATLATSELQKRLTNNDAFSFAQLKAFNTLRSAVLAASPADAQKLWQQIETRSQSADANDIGYQLLAALLKDGDVSLTKYLTYLTAKNANQ
jgi:hypothetical protein